MFGDGGQVDTGDDEAIQESGFKVVSWGKITGQLGHHFATEGLCPG